MGAEASRSGTKYLTRWKNYGILSYKEIFMPEPAKRDPKAPKFLEITIKDSEGKLWSTLYARAKDFSTGSVGYFASEKITNPESAERYQSSLSFTLIGSKPGK
jgi:hypothetical protein